MHADFPVVYAIAPSANASQAGRHGFMLCIPSGVAHHSAVCVALNASRTTLSQIKPELLTLVYLMTTLMPNVPATTGSLKYTAHGFGTEFSLMFFDEDILHFRRLAKVCRGLLENGQFLIPFCQRTLQMGDSLRASPVRGRRRADFAVCLLRQL